MKFTREFIEEDVKAISTQCIRHGRWYSQHRVIFEHEGKFYEIVIDRPLTEFQEGYYDPAGEVECKEVFASEETVTVYKAAKP